jgi:hypothetical protein
MKAGLVGRVFAGLLIILILTQLNMLAVAAKADTTGKWQSIYNFGAVEEVITADIQQVDENLIGSFAVLQKPSGEEYSGVVYGTIEGDRFKVYYLAAKDQGKKNPNISVTFAEGSIVDKNTLRGTYYYKDSDQVSLSGPYEAIRV